MPEWALLRDLLLLLLVFSAFLAEATNASASPEALRRPATAVEAEGGWWVQAGHARTVYLMPMAGLGNRLGAIATLLTAMYEHERSVSIRIIWGGSKGASIGPWEDIFSAPELTLAPDFPSEGGRQCSVHRLLGPHNLTAALQGGWELMDGEEVLCLDALGAVITEADEARWFYDLLRPSEAVFKLMEGFQQREGLRNQRWIGVHMRRRDTVVIEHRSSRRERSRGLQSAASGVGRVIEAMNNLKSQSKQDVASYSRPVRFLLACDDSNAEAQVVESFPEGTVAVFKGRMWKEASAHSTGIQGAAAELFLLAACEGLITTYHSRISSTANIIGNISAVVREYKQAAMHVVTMSSKSCSCSYSWPSLKPAFLFDPWTSVSFASLWWLVLYEPYIPAFQGADMKDFIQVVSRIAVVVLCSFTCRPVEALWAEGDDRVPTRPDHTEYAKMARWLVHQNTWGTVSTVSRHLNGAPFGNVLSFSDGAESNSTGRLIFYLTTMDATASDAQANPMASLTLAEEQIPGSCGKRDPEDPTCAKLNISGSLEPVPEGQVEDAQHIMFSRHPAMASWPEGHHFQLYELHIMTMRLLDFYGGARDLRPEEYLSCMLN